MLAQAADALDYAHSEGVVHRDVKPANILVRADGKVKITDFGIARIASQTVTRTGFTMGTPAYMSPEQVVSAKVAGPADQFSLGVIAFQMLSGRRPFEADTSHALMYQIVSVEAPPLHTVNPAIPQQVSKVVAKALAKRPEDRFSSCKEFAARLADALAARADQDAVETATMQPVAPTRRRRWALVAIATALAVPGLAGVAWWKWQSKIPPAQPPAQTTIPPSQAPAAPKERTKAPVNPPTPVVAAAARPKAPAPREPQTQPLRAGATQVNPNDGLTYAWIPPGTFQMGCSPGDGECAAEEKPAHTVTLSKGFWIGQTEVTQRGYERVLGVNPSNVKGPKLPVDSITWYDARNYCEAAGMRLPTEAEWEYAARAGTTGSRYGSLDVIAWFVENSGGGVHLVGQKRPNVWGLYDMIGNVWEWVADRYDRYPSDSVTDPQGPSNGTLRVHRGGGYSNPNIVNVRASTRHAYLPTYRGVGVRCAANSMPEKKRG